MPKFSEKPDFEALRDHCENYSFISEGVVDEFLLGFAASHNGLEKK